MLIFSEARRERNLFAWLVSRSANLRRLSSALCSEDGVPTGVSNEIWRVYLGTDVTEREIHAGQLAEKSNSDNFTARAPAQSNLLYWIGAFLTSLISPFYRVPPI